MMEYLDSWCLLKYPIELVFIVILFFVIRTVVVEISVYLKVMSYSKIPGVGTYYFPMSGTFNLRFRGDLTARTDNICNLFKANADKKMLVVNIYPQKFNTVTVFFMDLDCVQEFCRKEQQFSKKESSFPTVPTISLGFPNNGDYLGIMQRSIFADFFVYDQLESLYDPMYKIMDGNFKEFIQDNAINNTEFKQIDLRDLLEKLLKDWNALLLFGFTSTKDLMIDMKEYPEVLNGKYHKPLPLDKNSHIDIISLVLFHLECGLEYVKEPFN